MTSSALDSTSGRNLPIGDGMRVAVLTNAPAPYRVPVFSRLAHEEGVQARFFFDGATDQAGRLDALPFDAEALGSRIVLRRRGYQDDEQVTLRFGFGYASRLAAFRPDVVISGEFGWRTLHADVAAMEGGDFTMPPAIDGVCESRDGSGPDMAYEFEGVALVGGVYETTAYIDLTATKEGEEEPTEVEDDEPVEVDTVDDPN